VEQLRTVAALLGVDPALATPEEFRAKYNVPRDAEDERELREMKQRLANPVHTGMGHYYARKIAELESRPPYQPEGVTP
jgi:hypothetical protein